MMDTDIAEQLGRIRKMQEESDKFNAEQRKLSAEQLKIGVEQLKLAAEERKFAAEERKLFEEGLKFRRERFVAPVVAIATLVAAILGGLGGVVAVIQLAIRAGGHP